MWRAITGCLPTKDMLRMKQVSVNALCVLCNREVETVNHVLLDCTFAKSCWGMIGNGNDNTTQVSFASWALNVYNTWSSENRQIGAMLCWTIWKCRNDLVWNQKCMEVTEAVHSAKVVLSQWKEAQDKLLDRSLGFLNPDDGDELWTPPTEHTTKLNTDAAVYDSSNRYTYVFAARNYKGELLEARSSCKEGSTTPVCAETMGIREALSWIKERQLQKVIVETDCLEAVQAIRGSATMVSYLGTIIQECRNLLVGMKDKGIDLKFVKRSANNLAHTLVSCSYSVADRIWKADDVSPEIIHVLETDFS